MDTHNLDEWMMKMMVDWLIFSHLLTNLISLRNIWYLTKEIEFTQNKNKTNTESNTHINGWNLIQLDDDYDDDGDYNNYYYNKKLSPPIARLRSNNKKAQSI